MPYGALVLHVANDVFGQLKNRSGYDDRGLFEAVNQPPTTDALECLRRPSGSKGTFDYPRTRSLYDKGIYLRHYI